MKLTFPSQSSLPILNSLTLLLLATQITGQLLTAVYLNATAPSRYLRALYDGDDKIYLFLQSSSVGIFSIATETISYISFPGYFGHRGTAHPDQFGNIYYFGSQSTPGNYHRVSKLDLVTNTSTTVASLPYDIVNTATIFDSENRTVYIFGGNDNTGTKSVLAFNLDTLNYIVLPEADGFLYSESSILVGRRGYLFGDSRALQFDLDTLNLTRVGPPTLPWCYYQSSVWTGEYAYIISVCHGTGGPTGITQFNPRTYENTFIPVTNFPLEGTRTKFDFSPAAAYVAKNNRIYCFGGDAYNYWRGDEVFYVDLTPLNEPL